VSRYDQHQKQQTRARIIDTAGRRLKRDGIDGTGVSALMSDAGLTNGAFYAHFGSKNELVAAVVADQLQIQHDILDTLPEDGRSLQSFIIEYLSSDHRDHPEEGCPSAALLDEIGKTDPVVREAYTAGIEDIIDVIAGRMSRVDGIDARGRALGLLTGLVGTVQLARAVTDPELSDEVLTAGLGTALRMLG
jgi:TetR/AcrR family transcriptional regulator, transcriptional repressor for nem operon